MQIFLRLSRSLGGACGFSRNQEQRDKGVVVAVAAAGGTNRLKCAPPLTDGLLNLRLWLPMSSLSRRRLRVRRRGRRHPHHDRISERKCVRMCDNIS